MSSLHRESTDSRAVSFAGFIYTKYVHALTPISQHALSIKDYVLGSALILDVALQYLVMGNCKGVKMSELLCLLLWSLVEVHSQTEFPYVSFRGETLLNHSYVNLRRVGRPDDPNNRQYIACHTDLFTCCSSRDGSHRGDWYFPNGTRLPLPGGGHLFEARTTQQVGLRRDYGTISTSGIYRCDIPTNDSDISARETVYIGVYASGGT